MTIYEDTRQQAGKHENIRRYCERHGITIIRQKLDCGDYMTSLDAKITVDTKSGLQEVYMDLIRERARFYREVRRCNENGIKLVLLIEQGGIRSIDDVAKWKPKYGKLTGRNIAERLRKLQLAWGVDVEFCSKQSTGKRLVEILCGSSIENCS